MDDSDDDFDDLLAEAELLEGSSQESLTTATAHLLFSDASDENGRQISQSTSASIPGSGDLRAETKQREMRASLFPCAADTAMPISETQAPPSSLDTSALSVIEKIEKIFGGIADALLQELNELAITINTRARAKARTSTSALRTDVSTDVVTTRRICFPGKTAEEAWRFSVIPVNSLGLAFTDDEIAVVLRILELIHEALRNDVVLSKRDIYYRDPALFGSQGTVDRYVDDIAFTFDVSRSMLNVSAVAKGLVAGAVSFCRRDGALVDATCDREGILVPNLREVMSVNMAAVKWILVIEKEATFRSIASSTFWDTEVTHGVIVTGKGYPDIATRALLHFLGTPSPQNGFASPPVYGLVDCDPDGLAILSVYRNGSIALSHENADLCVPSLQWLGLRNEHMTIDGDDVHTSQGLLTLTTRDRRKAVKMLERCAALDDGSEMEVRQALQNTLMFNIKAELQLLDAIPNGMTSLLTAALACL